MADRNEVLKSFIDQLSTELSDILKYLPNDKELSLSSLRTALPAIASTFALRYEQQQNRLCPKTLISTLPEWRTLQALSLVQKTHPQFLGEGAQGKVQIQLSLTEDRVLSGNFIAADFSKCSFTSEILHHLVSLLNARDFSERRRAMFAGEPINSTEHRSVLHTALRNVQEDKTGSCPVGLAMHDDKGTNVMPGIQSVLLRMKALCQTVRSGEWKGATGKRIRFVVNIGIGGSDLGPLMVYEALHPYADDTLKAFFVSNIDGAAMAKVLGEVRIEETLFIIASKTFTTAETMTNAHTARTALLKHLKNVNCGSLSTDAQRVARHFVALSTNAKAVSAFGIEPTNMFEFWEWVGGRYSVWSAIGLSVALSIGWDAFWQFLQGARAMDVHFCTAPPESNIPVMMAMAGLWHNNFLGFDTHAVLPYSQQLHRFPAYLQQLDMESNGKRAVQGAATPGYYTDVATSPIVWGEPGTNGQHAFYQSLHQGSRVVPCDFIATTCNGYVRHADNELEGLLRQHHSMLNANVLAQAEAMAYGKSSSDVEREVKSKTELFAHKSFDGGRPSTLLLMRELTPCALGALIAAYEHKVFVQGLVWGINSFDQWGVELGKVLATQIGEELKGSEGSKGHDAGTMWAMKHIQQEHKPSHY